MSVLLPATLFSAVVAAAVTLTAAHPPALLFSRVMRQLGQVSYCTYLVHVAPLSGSPRSTGLPTELPEPLPGR